MPEIVRVAWNEECEFRGVDGSALLRSLIHAYLMSDREPEQVLGYWLYKGRTYRLPKGNRNKFAEKALITNGSWRALLRRCQRRGCSASAMMRALVLEVLAGEHRAVQLIDARTMFDDEDRYHLGGSIGDS
jgi:hypothetical protein